MMSTSPPSTVVHGKLESSTRPLSIRTRTLVQVLSLASTAAFFDSAVHAWAQRRRAPGLAPVAAAVGACALSVGGCARKVPVARARACAGGRRGGPRAQELPGACVGSCACSVQAIWLAPAAARSTATEATGKAEGP